MEEEIVLRFKADLTSYSAELRKAQSLTNSFIRETSSGMKATSTSTQRTKKEVDRMATSFSKATKQSKSFTSSVLRGLKPIDKLLSRISTNMRTMTIGGMHDLLTIQSMFQIKQGAEYIIEAADSYQLMQDRLRLVTSETVAYRKEQDKLQKSFEGFNQGAINILLTQQKLYKIAQDSRSDLETITNTYTVLARNINDTTISTQNLIDVTEAISKALLVSGASAQSADAALVQFGQGLAANALRGQELNSVMEQTPRIARAIADGLNVGLGELRAMAAEGKLTAKVTADALRSQLGVLREEAKAIAPTFGQTFTQIQNYFKVTLGQIVQATGVTRDFNAELTKLMKGMEAGHLTLADNPLVVWAARLKEVWIWLKRITTAATYFLTWLGDKILSLWNPINKILKLLSEVSLLWSADLAKKGSKVADMFGFDSAAESLKGFSNLYTALSKDMSESIKTHDEDYAKASKQREEALKNLKATFLELEKEYQNSSVEKTIKEWDKAYLEYIKNMKALKKVEEERKKDRELDAKTTKLLLREYNNMLKEAALTDPIDIDKFKAKINEAANLLKRIKAEGRFDTTDTGASPTYDSALIRMQQVEQTFTKKHLDTIKDQYQGALQEIKQNMDALRVGQANINNLSEFQESIQGYKEAYINNLKAMYDQGLIIEEDYNAKRAEINNKTNRIIKQQNNRAFEDYFNQISYYKQLNTQVADEKIRELAAKLRTQLELLKQANRITAEEFNKTMSKLNKATTGTFASDWEKTFTEVGKSMTTLFGDVMMDSFRRLMDGAKDWGDYFKDVIKDVIAELMKLIVVQQIVRSMMGSFGGGGLGAASAASTGAVTAFAQGGIVTSPTAFPTTNGIGVMGEAGAEAIMPLTRMPNGDLGVQASPMQVNVYNYTSDEVTTNTDENGNLELIIKKTEAAIATGINRGTSIVGTAIASSYGLRR